MWPAALVLTASNETQVGSTSMYVSSDQIGALQNIYTEFWNSEDMTADEVIAKLVNAFETIE